MSDIAKGHNHHVNDYCLEGHCPGWKRYVGRHDHEAQPMTPVERAAEVSTQCREFARFGWLTGKEHERVCGTLYLAADLIDTLAAGLQLTDADRAVLDAARHLIDLAVNESRIVTEAEHMLAFQALVDADRARRETQS